ncbi:DinB family protein [Ornithinimicrobium faecis]|uniref:DinB family protein n=1 Tax=Ornithinimicrobium faecis TaxID=2934158 RepID=UPI0021185CF9|nr:DinB family protein [Ornithinimicrobium sp. HY1745]
MTTSTSSSTPPTQRVAPPEQGDEAAQLRGYVDFLRDSLRMKAEGLTAEQLHTRHEPSALTLGGLLKHLAFVEHWWFSCVLHGRDFAEPWASVDWDADEDWDYNSAAADTPAELFALFDATIAESDRITDEALATPEGLDTIAVRHPADEDPVNLRYILLHMIEEHGRHAGHADLIRESIDGSTGE